MHVYSVPAVFAENLEQNLWPLILSIFLGYNQLKVKRKGKIELVCHSTLLFLHYDGGYTMGNTFQTIDLFELFISQR